jgi:hypothetical protein
MAVSPTPPDRLPRWWSDLSSYHYDACHIVNETSTSSAAAGSRSPGTRGTRNQPALVVAPPPHARARITKGVGLLQRHQTDPEDNADEASPRCTCGAPSVHHGLPAAGSNRRKPARPRTGTCLRFRPPDRPPASCRHAFVLLHGTQSTAVSTTHFAVAPPWHIHC